MTERDGTLHYVPFSIQFSSEIIVSDNFFHFVIDTGYLGISTNNMSFSSYYFCFILSDEVSFTSTAGFFTS